MLCSLLAALLLAAPAHAAAPKPEAVVSASSGPVKLTFSVQRTKVKAGGYVWYRIELKNTAKDSPILVDEIFHRPDWFNRKTADVGTYIELRAPDGRRQVERKGRLTAEGAVPLTTAQEALVGKRLAELRAAGLDEFEVQRRIGDYARSLSEGEEKVQWLPPGQSTRTAAWRYPAELEEGERLGQAVPGYTQLWHLPLRRPGRYKVRVVYDHEPPGRRKNPGQVRFTTPWITVEALP